MHIYLASFENHRSFDTLELTQIRDFESNPIGYVRMANQKASPSLVFPLLKLPAELRNRIWDYVVVLDKPLRIVKKDRRMDQAKAKSVLAVASTCRQIYQETTSLYYLNNWYTIDLGTYHTLSESKFRDAQTLVHDIGSERARQIRNVSIVCSAHMETFDIHRLLNIVALGAVDARVHITYSLALRYRRAVLPAGSTILFIYQGRVCGELDQNGTVGMVSLKKDVGPLQHLTRGAWDRLQAMAKGRSSAVCNGGERSKLTIL